MAQDTNRDTRAEIVRPPACDGCGTTENAITYPGRLGETLCPRCAALYQLDDLCLEHLVELVTPVMLAWRNHWAARGMPDVSMQRLLDDGIGDELVSLFDATSSNRTPSTVAGGAQQ